MGFSVAATGRRKESGNLFPELTFQLSLHDKERKSGNRKRIFAYLCAFNALSCLSGCRAVSPIGMHDVLAAAVRSLGFAQRPRFFVKGEKVTAVFRVIIAIMSAHDSKKEEKGSLFTNS